MFGSRKEAVQRLKLVEAAFDELEAAHKALLATVETINKRSILIGIERAGKLNKFTFVRNGSPFVIETYGTLSDDVKGWKKDLLE